MTLYVEQEGKCYYTGEPLNIVGGQEEVLSIDKVLPDVGYIKGNVVLCLNRFNILKRDMTLSECHYWFHPDIFSKMLNKVNNLLATRL